MDHPTREYLAYMQEVKPTNGEPGIRYFVSARCKDQEGCYNVDYIATSHRPARAAHYCHKDNAIFPMKGCCPICGVSVPVWRGDDLPGDDAPKSPPVQPLNAPI